MGLSDQVSMDGLSSGGPSLEPLVSFHGPNEFMQGVILGPERRGVIEAESEIAMGKMRRFCA